MYHYKNVDFDISVLWQTACVVVNPIMVDNLHPSRSDLRLYDGLP